MARNERCWGGGKRRRSTNEGRVPKGGEEEGERETEESKLEMERMRRDNVF